MVQRVQRIEEEGSNRQIQLAKAATQMIEAFNKSSVETSKNIEEDCNRAKKANKGAEEAKYKEMRPSRVAALALIVSTLAFAASGLSNYTSPLSQAISLGSDAWKKPYEAKGISSSGLEQYTRIAMEKLREMISMTAKAISEITSEVTNINRQNSGI